MRKKTYLKLVDYQTEQSEKHLNEVRSIHKEMRGYKHDFHHHLQTLKGQLEAGEIERALAYIEQLDTQLMQVDTLLKTGMYLSMPFYLQKSHRQRQKLLRLP